MTWWVCVKREVNTTHSCSAFEGSGLDDPRDVSACLDIITYDEPTWYGTHESHWSRTQRTSNGIAPRPRPHDPNSGPIRIRPSLAHNSGDTHNAIQQRAQRDAHDRIHTGLTRRRSRQRAQRPANGRPEAPRAHVHDYMRARARSLVALDGGSNALDARRPAARLPATLAEQLVDRAEPGLGGRLKELLPCRPRYGPGSGARRELAKYRHESQNWVAK